MSAVLSEAMGAGIKISLTCVPGMWALRTSKALIELIPPMMKMSSPQLMTWLPSFSLAELSDHRKSFDTHKSSSDTSWRKARRASSSSGVRAVRVAAKSDDQVMRPSAAQLPRSPSDSSCVPFNTVETMSPFL